MKLKIIIETLLVLTSLLGSLNLLAEGPEIVSKEQVREWANKSYFDGIIGSSWRHSTFLQDAHQVQLDTLAIPAPKFNGRDTLDHGTYKMPPFISFPKAKDPDSDAWVRYLVTDTGLTFKLDLEDLENKVYKATLHTDFSESSDEDHSISGLIQFNVKECYGTPCFTYKSQSEDGSIKNGLYMPATRDSDVVDTSRRIDDTFTRPIAPATDNMSRCWNVTKLDALNLQYQGCDNIHIFETPGSDADYFFQAPQNDDNGHYTQFGYYYQTYIAGMGSVNVLTASNGDEVSKMHAHSTGYKGGFGIGSYKFGGHRNKTSKDMTESIVKNEKTTSMAYSINKVGSLHLDKKNNRLSGNFIDSLLSLRDGSLDFSDFFDTYGTHYANVLTLGTIAYSQKYFDRNDIRFLSQHDVSIGKGISAGYSVSLPAGDTGLTIDGSVDFGKESGTEDSLTKAWNRIHSSEQDVSFCVGGSGCTGAQSAGNDKPAVIFADLRPIWQLLAPPFFDDYDTTVVFRERFIKEWIGYLKENLGSKDMSIDTMRAMTISGQAYCTKFVRHKKCKYNWKKVKNVCTVSQNPMACETTISVSPKNLYGTASVSKLGSEINHVNGDFNDFIVLPLLAYNPKTNPSEYFVSIMTNACGDQDILVDESKFDLESTSGAMGNSLAIGSEKDVSIKCPAGGDVRPPEVSYEYQIDQLVPSSIMNRF